MQVQNVDLLNAPRYLLNFFEYKFMQYEYYLPVDIVNQQYFNHSANDIADQIHSFWS